MPRDRRGERDLSTERGVVFRSSEVNTRGVNKDINKGGAWSAWRRARRRRERGELCEEAKGGNTIRGVDGG